MRERLILSGDSHQSRHCYQVGHDWDVSYGEASLYCTSELRGALASLASLPTLAGLRSGLTQVPFGSRDSQWWLEADSPSSCWTLDSSGSVSQQDCGGAPPPGQTVRNGVLHYHWSRYNETRLSLVQSFRVLLAPTILCNKEPARCIQSPLLWAMECGFGSCSSLVVYGKWAPIIGPFHAWKATILMP